MIVAVVGEKGGTGKTTLAVHLAGWRTMAGRDVMLLDADPQGSSGQWVSFRREFTDKCPASVPAGARVGAAVIDFAKRYDDVVVDIGAGDGLGMEMLMRVADVALIPLQPNAMDVWTMPNLDELVGIARELNPKLRANVVLNKAPTHRSDNDAKAALRALDQCENIQTLDCMVRERTSIKRGVPQGYLIDEWRRPSDEKAIDELLAVFERVYELDQAVAPAELLKIGGSQAS